MKISKKIFLNSTLFSSFFIYRGGFFKFLLTKETSPIYGLVTVCLLSSFDFLFFSYKKLNIFFSQKKFFFSFISLIQSCLNFMSFGYFVDLTLKGKGFYNFSFSKYVALELGYSHRVLVPIPEGVVFKKFKYRLGFFSLDFVKLFNFVHCLLNLKKLNIYKAKGIYFQTSKLNIKVGKKR